MPMLFQSSPGPKAGCYAIGLVITYLGNKFQSSPGPKAGCYSLPSEEDKVAHHARHRKRPAFERDAVDIDHRLGRPGAGRPVEVPHHTRKCRSDEALLCLGIVLQSGLG